MTAAVSSNVYLPDDEEKREERFEKVIRYNIQRLMRLRGFYQKDLAQAMDVTPAAVSYLLSGETAIKAKVMYRAAAALGVRVEDLIDDSWLAQDEEFVAKMKEAYPLANPRPRFFVNLGSDRMVPSVGLEPTLRRF